MSDAAAVAAPVAAAPVDMAAAPAAGTATPIDASGAGGAPSLEAPVANATSVQNAVASDPAAVAAPAIPAVPSPEGGADYTGVKQGDGTSEHAALSPEEVSAFIEFARSAGYTPEQAQAQLDYNTAQSEKFWANHSAQVEEWLTDAKSDPDLAGRDGAQWGATEARVQKVMARFGNDEMRTLLDVTGLGNHPAFVKFVNSVGQTMSEESLALVGGGAASSSSERPEDILYR